MWTSGANLGATVHYARKSGTANKRQAEIPPVSPSGDPITETQHEA